MTTSRSLHDLAQTEGGLRASAFARAATSLGGGLPLVLSLAVLVRLLGILARPIWYDEAFAILFSDKGPAAMLVGTLSPTSVGAADIHPLGYYTLLWLWMRFLGESLVSARALSIAAGLATIIVAYGLAGGLFGRTTAVVLALILALSPFQVHYSQEIRMYAFLGFWLTLATYCFWRATNTAQWRWWVGFAISAAIAQYTHNLAAAYLLALALWPLLTGDWRTLRRITLAGLGAVALCIPWLVNLPAQLAKVSHAYRIAGPGIHRLLTLPLAFVANLPVQPNMLGIALFASLGATALALLVGFRGAKNEPERFRASSWMLYLSFVPPLILFVISQWTPVYLERALIASGVTFCIWLASSLTSSSLTSGGRWILASLLVLGFGVGLWQHLSYRGFPYAPFDSIATDLRSRLHAGDAIIHSSKLSFLPSLFFDPTLPATYVADPPGSSVDTLATSTQAVLGIHAATDIEDAAGNASRVWLALYDQSNEEYFRAGYPRHPHLTWLLLHYRLAETRQWDDLTVYLFTTERPR